MNQRFKTRANYPPGVWEDKSGELHFSLPEIMEHLGIPFKPKNQEKTRQIFDELLRANVPDAEIIYQKHCPFCGQAPSHKENCPNK